MQHYFITLLHFYFQMQKSWTFTVSVSMAALNVALTFAAHSVRNCVRACVCACVCYCNMNVSFLIKVN